VATEYVAGYLNGNLRGFATGTIHTSTTLQTTRPGVVGNNSTT